MIRGFHTSQRALDTLRGLLSRLQKEAIVVEDLPGFVSNRISHLFMNEAAFVLQDRVASAAEIDQIFKQCFGHKMGPLETADLIGLDTVMRSLDVLYDSFHDPKYRCCPLLRKLVHAGHLGRKTGKDSTTMNSNEIKHALRGFILRSVRVPRLGDDEDLFESGIVNSLFAVQLMTFVEKNFSIEVAMEDLEIDNFRSVNATTGFVLRKNGAHAAAAD